MHCYISVNPLWSYNFIGGLKDYYSLDIDTSVLNTVYEITAEYIRLRYNFLAGHIPNTEYNIATHTLNHRINSIDVEAAFVNWFLENIFRELMPALNINPGAVHAIQPVNNSTGDIIGFSVQKTLH